MKNVLTPVVKNVLQPLGATTATSATDAVIKKKLRIRHDYIDNFK